MRYIINEFGKELEVSEQVAQQLLGMKLISEHDQSDVGKREYFLAQTADLPGQTDPSDGRVVAAWLGVKSAIRWIERNGSGKQRAVPLVVIEVRGGVVQGVYSEELVDVHILDHDNGDTVPDSYPLDQVPDELKTFFKEN